MNPEAGKDMFDPGHAVLRVLDRRPPHDAVDLIPFFQKKFRKVTPILAGDPGDQRSFHPLLPSSRASDMFSEKQDG
jgi:hypothetical protein